MSKRVLRTVLLTLLGVLVLFMGLPAQGMIRPADGSPTDGDSDYAYVRFGNSPIASYSGTLRGYARTKPDRGSKLDLNSPAAIRYAHHLRAQQEQYIRWLARHYPQVEVVTRYTVTFNGLGLNLNGATLPQVSAGPGAVDTGPSGIYHKLMSVSPTLVHASAAWAALGGQDRAGGGVMVGIIDSGIDAAHPFFADTGMTAPPGFPKGDTRFTSRKVIVARVFHQDPWQTPVAVDSHGTHVAGTVAGRAGTPAPPAAAPVSGIAPGAWLGNYNVFPGNVAEAHSLFIAKAVETAVVDGMDVLNLSLGGGPHRGADLLDMAVNAATDAGVVVAIAAGNEGPGTFTVSSPGTASQVITVAATSNSHTFAMFLESLALPGGRTLATTGTQGGKLNEPMTETYAVWADHAGGDKFACGPIAGTPLSGQIALIQRGVCIFTSKINNAAAAGAAAAIIYQRDDQADPVPMSTDGALIPAVMIGRDAGYTLVDWTGDRTVTLVAPAQEVAATPNLLADFSSWGPTPNYLLKPDVAAPGVNVYSSVPGGGFEAFMGTSMATPHVAGAAALLVAYSRLHDLGWSPQEIKSALVGTGRPAVDTDDPLQVGGGIIDLARALQPPALAAPASLSFGLVRPVGNHRYSLTFTLTNASGAARTYILAENTGALDLSPSTVTLTPGEKIIITATVMDRGVPEPGQGGLPVLKRGHVTATSAANAADAVRIPYLYVIDYNR